MMKNTESLTVVEHAIRWSNNILTEVLSNHGRKLNPVAREHLKAAVCSLAEAFESIRKEQP